MTDVLFVFVTDGAEYHLGLAALAGALRARGMSSDLCRLHLAEGADVFPARLAAALERAEPLVVAVSAVSCLWPATAAVLERLRSMSDLPVLVGGWHATLAPEAVLAHPRVTAVCVGEGEEALPDFVDAVRRRAPVAGIPNIWTARDNGCRPRLRPPAPRLEALAPPRHELFDLEDLLCRNVIGILGPEGPPRVMAVAAGRGCPHRCTHCGNAAFQDRYGLPPRAFLRRRPVAAVLKEIAALKATHQPAWIEFWDEEFTQDRLWLEEFCAGFPGCGLPFTVMARPDRLGGDVVRRLAAAGCGLVMLGVESGDEAYRASRLRRTMSNASIRRAFDAARAHGIATLSFSMIGLPFESLESMDRTLELNAQIEPDFLALFQYNPYPGTELYRTAQAAGLLSANASPNLALSDAPNVRGVAADAYRERIRRGRALQEQCRAARSRRYPGRFGGAVAGQG